MLHKADFSKAF